MDSGAGVTNLSVMADENDDTSWDDRLGRILSDEWQSAETIAARLHAKSFTVLARLKDMMRRNLVERRITQHATKKHAGRPLQQAEFRRTQLGRPG